MSTVLHLHTDIIQGNGTFILDVDTSAFGVDHNSGVWATICEVFDQANEPFIGDAFMDVLNVAPTSDGHVLLRVQIDWPSPLQYRVRLLLSND